MPRICCYQGSALRLFDLPNSFIPASANPWVMCDVTILFSNIYAAWMVASKRAKLLKIGIGQWYLGVKWVENPKVVGWLALLHTIQRSQTAPNNPFERLQVSHFIIPCADRMSILDLISDFHIGN